MNSMNYKGSKERNCASDFANPGSLVALKDPQSRRWKAGSSSSNGTGTPRSRNAPHSKFSTSMSVCWSPNLSPSQLPSQTKIYIRVSFTTRQVGTVRGHLYCTGIPCRKCWGNQQWSSLRWWHPAPKFCLQRKRCSSLEKRKSKPQWNKTSHISAWWLSKK